ncbi:MAG: hypothetical protein ACRDTC_07775 [Pseudonocardiaceae bacterium]
MATPRIREQRFFSGAARGSGMAKNVPVTGHEPHPNLQLENLISAVKRVPIPTSPQPSDSYQEALGLNILSLALRLEHIDRLSESLVLVDSTHMSRSVSVDINISSLTEEQKSALRSDSNADGGAPAMVWLPIARHTRKDLAPVLVKNRSGDVLARATNRKAVEAMTHGLTRSFQMFLNSDPRTEDSTQMLYKVRHQFHQSRWLIKSAIAKMIDGSVPVDGPAEAPDKTPHESHSHSRTDSDWIRSYAVEAVEQLFAGNSPFLQLLAVASLEYILIVEVPTKESQVFVHYTAPVMPAQSRALRRKNASPFLSTLNNELTVEYQTVIPRAVNSYHVTVSVPEEIQIRRFFMTSDVDSPAVKGLIADMGAVAEEYRHLEVKYPNLLEQELQSIASRLAELGRRRACDLEYFKAYLRGCYSLFSQRSPRFRRSIRSGVLVKAVQYLPSAPRLVSHLARFSRSYEAGHFPKLSTDHLDKDVLERLAERLTNSDFDKDLSVDNDPREHAGHAHWSRRPFGPGSQSIEPINARVYIALVDDPPSLTSSVSRLLFAVFALVLGVALFLQPGLFGDMLTIDGVLKYLQMFNFGNCESELCMSIVSPADREVPSSADAIVTVLLLVPGLMLSRLDIPSHKTVLGRLRLFPRYVAYMSVIVPSSLAVVVATSPSYRIFFPLVFSIYVLMLLVLIMIINGVTRALRRRSRVPSRRPTPSWLLPEISAIPVIRRKSAVEFSTVEGGSNA